MGTGTVTMMGMIGRERAMYLPLIGEVKNTPCIKGAKISNDMMAIVRTNDFLRIA
jgi:hypothetical protein